MKIGIQSSDTILELGAEKTYRLFAESGFEVIDWNLDNYLMPQQIIGGNYSGNCIFEKDLDEITAFFASELDIIRKNGLTISQAHAPFPAYTCEYPEMLDHMIGIYKKVILFCDRVGCKNLIIHEITHSKNDCANTPETIRELNDRMYTELIPTLCQTDVTVCMENLGAGAVGLRSNNCHEAASYIDRLNGIAGKECFGLCMDTGHFNLLKQKFQDYVPVLGKRIKAFHIHDNDGISDQHKAPYTGTIIWKDFYNSLRNIGYSGDICFETFRQTTLEVIDQELLEPWLKLIAQIGNHFRNRILGK